MKREKQIIMVEAIGFFIVVIAVWFNEFYDLPHYLFGMPLERFNYHEAGFESVFVLVLAAVIIAVTRRLIRRVEQLEAFLPICSFCKKIRKVGADPFKQDSWVQLELYIEAKTGSEFSHGLCPECAEKHYGKYGKP